MIAAAQNCNNNVTNMTNTNIFAYLERDLNQFKFQNLRSTPTILFGAAGGLENLIKGFTYLYQSFSIARKKYPDLQLALFGQKSLPAFLRDDRQIINLGVIDNESEIAQIMNCCTALALPSVIDNLPQIAVEAISCGTAVIAHNVGGISDIVKDGINGVLVPFGNVDLFAQALIAIIDNSLNLKSRREISTLAHLEFNPALIAQKYMNYYYKLMAD